MIRQAQDPRDVALFLSVRRSFGLETDEVERKSETYLDDLCDSIGRACFLLEDERGRAVGYVQLVWAGEEPGQALLHDLRIKANLQSRGFGRQLVDHLERFAADREYKALRLWVETENARALGFYTSLGYHLTGSEDGLGALEMRKALSRG